MFLKYISRWSVSCFLATQIQRMVYKSLLKMLRFLDHIQTSFFFFSCAKKIKVKRKLTKQEKKKTQEELDKFIFLQFCICASVITTPVLDFLGGKKTPKWNIDGHLRKKRKRGKKKIKNTSLCVHTSLFCHCISSASAERDFIILPWKTALSGSWQMNSLNCVDHFILCLFMAYNKKTNLKYKTQSSTY